MLRVLLGQLGRRTVDVSIITRRHFAITARHLEKALPPRRKVEDSEIEESFLKGTGPGGQKINKTSSAVQLKHIPTGIVVKCQETRSREQNRKYARQILGEKLDQLENGDQSRAAIKTERAKKKKASRDKKTKRKYRKLAEEKADASDEHAPGAEQRSAGDRQDLIENIRQ